MENRKWRKKGSIRAKAVPFFMKNRNFRRKSEPNKGNTEEHEGQWKTGHNSEKSFLRKGQHNRKWKNIQQQKTQRLAAGSSLQLVLWEKSSHLQWDVSRIGNGSRKSNEKPAKIMNYVGRTHSIWSCQFIINCLAAGRKKIITRRTTRGSKKQFPEKGKGQQMIRWRKDKGKAHFLISFIRKFPLFYILFLSHQFSYFLFSVFLLFYCLFKLSIVYLLYYNRIVSYKSSFSCIKLNSLFYFITTFSSVFC